MSQFLPHHLTRKFECFELQIILAAKKVTSKINKMILFVISKHCIVIWEPFYNTIPFVRVPMYLQHKAFLHKDDKDNYLQ